MTWDQILELLLGLVVVTLIGVEIINWLAICQTNKLSLQKWREEKKSRRSQARFEKRQQAAEDLYRILKGGFKVLPIIQEEIRYIEGSPFINYGNFAFNLIESINQDKLDDIKVEMQTFFNVLNMRTKGAVNNKILEVENQVIDYFLDLIISSVESSGEDYRDFRLRYMHSEYKSKAPDGYIRWNYKLDISKLNKDIKFVNKILNKHIKYFNVAEEV